MTVICTKPTTPESRKRHAETFGEDPFSRSRWLQLGRPDETYAEWVSRIKGIKGCCLTMLDDNDRNAVCAAMGIKGER